MAEPFVGEEPNPFQGVSFGRAADMLLRDPTGSLDKKFDEAFPDKTQVDLLTRASLHWSNMFYRDSPTGALSLRALQDTVINPPQEEKVEITPAQEAREAWAQRLAGGVKRGQEFKPRTMQDALKENKAQYNKILDDLAEYERMTPASGFWEHTVALGGGLAGAVLSVENVAAWPIRGATAIGRIVMGGLQTAAVNVVADPIAQLISINTELRKEFDPTQTALSTGMGAIVGMGLVGVGEVLTSQEVRRAIWSMRRSDPQLPQVDRLLVEPGPGSTRLVMEPPERPLDLEVRLAEPVPQQGAYSQEFNVAVAGTSEPVKVSVHYVDGKFSEVTYSGPYGEGSIAVGPDDTGLVPEELVAKLFGNKPTPVEAESTAVIRAEPEPIVTRREEPPPSPPQQEPTIAETPGAEPTLYQSPQPTAPTPKETLEVEWIKIGPQKGSNPGGLYKDKDGVEWYLKTPPKEGQIRAETISNRLYGLAGIVVPDVKFITLDGSFGIGSKMFPAQYKPLGQYAPEGLAYNEAVKQIREGFAVDAWLANWDVIGQAWDNVLVRQLGDSSVSIARVDQGGTLQFRAQGESKPFGPEVPEIKTLRDPKMNKEAAAIFGDMSDEEVIASIEKIKYISPTAIHSVVAKYGSGNTLTDAVLAVRIEARRDYLVNYAESLKNKIEAPPVSSQTQTFTKKAPAKKAKPQLGKTTTFVAGEEPAAIEGAPFAPWSPPKNWNDVSGSDVKEPPVKLIPGKTFATGAIVREPDGRVWLVKPKGGYGGYEHTFPKGQLEPGLGNQQNAIKEIWEESGLKVKLTAWAGDYEGTTSLTRYYYAERTGGTPTGFGDETEAVVLAHPNDLQSLLNAPRDKEIVKDLGIGEFSPKLSSTKKARLARAEKQGYHTDLVLYHTTKGSTANIKFLAKEFSGTEPAIFATPTKAASTPYGSKTIELFHRATKIMVVEPHQSPFNYGTGQSYNHGFFKTKIKEAEAQGMELVIFKNVSDLGPTADQYAFLTNNVLRSTKAMFDPKKIASKDLYAMEAPKGLAEQYEDLIRGALDDELRLARLETKEELAITSGPLQGLPPGVPVPGRSEEVVQSLQQMSAKLEARFGVAIRQRKTPPGTAGTFNPNTGVISVRELANFQVNAHEVAHQIATRMAGDVQLNGTSPLAQLANGTTEAIELAGLDYISSRGNIGEGFAEYIRLFMTNPSEARARAPAFNSGFVNLLERDNPGLLKDLLDFQGAYEAYDQASPVAKVRAAVVIPSDSAVGRAINYLAQANVAPTVGNVLNLLPEVLTNSDHAVSVVTRELGKAVRQQLGGRLVDLPPSKDPVALMRMYRQFTKTAMSQARDGVIQWGDTHGSGPSLRQVLGRAFGTSYLYGLWDEKIFGDFGTYLKAREVAIRWDQVHQGKLSRSPTSETEQEIRQVIIDLERQYPSFREAGDLFTQFNRNYLRRKTDSGAFLGLDDEAHDRIVASSPDFYAPLRRDVKKLMKAPGRAKGDVPDPGVHEFKGSLLDVIHPVVAVLNDLTQSEAQMAHAQLARAFKDLAEMAGSEGGRFVEMLPAHEVKAIEFDLGQSFTNALVARGGHTMNEADRLFENIFGSEKVIGLTFKMIPNRGPVILWATDGKLQAAQFIRKGEQNLALGLYEIMISQPKPALDVWVKTMGIVSHTFTAGITSHWAYILRNLFRDQFAAAFYVPGYIPYWHFVEGAWDVLTNAEASQAYRSFGGVSPAGSLHPAFADAVEADIKALQAQGYNIRKVGSLRALAEMLSVGELATRVGATKVLYRQKKKQGLSDYDAWMAAVNESSDMLPFDRVGSGMHSARTLIPFLGAWAQSMSKLYRRTGEPLKQGIHHMLGSENGFVFTRDTENARKGAIGVAGAVFGGIGIGMMYAASQWERPGYQDAKDKVKATNIVFPLENGDIVLLPKPWELALGFTAGEYLYASLMKNDPRAGKQFAMAVYESLASPNFIFGNPMMKFKEIAANYNSFTGGPIVSEEMMKKDPYLQYDYTSSAAAKAMGNAARFITDGGWSPKKIDYTISSFFPYWGRDVQMMSAGTDDGDSVSMLMNMTLYRMGLRDPNGLSDASEKFWEHMGRVTGKYNRATTSYRGMLQNPQTRWQAKEYYDALPTNLKVWVTLKESGNAKGELTFKPEARMAHPLERGRVAAGIVNQMRKDVLGNTVLDQRNKNNIVVNPELRQKVARYLGQIALAEYSNALIIMDEPGYADRALTEPDTYMAQIENIAPNIAQELRRRYANAKVYRTEDVAWAYPQMKDALLRDGARARLGPITARLEGKYEFSGRRERGQRRPYREPLQGDSNALGND